MNIFYCNALNIPIHNRTQKMSHYLIQQKEIMKKNYELFIISDGREI